MGMNGISVLLGFVKSMDLLGPSLVATPDTSYLSLSTPKIPSGKR